MLHGTIFAKWKCEILRAAINGYKIASPDIDSLYSFIALYVSYVTVLNN